MLRRTQTMFAISDASDPRFDRIAKRTEPESWTHEDATGVVASAHYLATDAGAWAFSQGGNAFDAAIAASFALSVVESAGSGLGGMAMATYYLAESAQVRSIAGPCRAPRLATPEAVAASHRYRGHRAVAVPGYVSALKALAGNASLPVSVLLAPAIDLAERGYPFTVTQSKLVHEYSEALAPRSAAAIFFPQAAAPPAGARFRQPALAGTLRRLADVGLDDFYHGDIAREIERDMVRHDGFVRLDDLRAMRAAQVQPLTVPFWAGTLHVVGPPAGGLTLAQMVRMADRWPAGVPTPDSAPGACALAKLIRRARTDRGRARLRIGADSPGDAASLLKDSYIGQTVEELCGVGETSHISAMDATGNTVALTQSIERSFGAAELSPELGFLYAGYLRAFKVENQRHPHFLRAGVPARSNASPSVVVHDGLAQLAIGCTGSERMNSAILCALVRHRHGATPFDMVAGPRLHAKPEGQVLIEAARAPAGVVRALADGGFDVQTVDPYAFKMGGMQLAIRTKFGLCAVADPRRDGAAAGASER